MMHVNATTPTPNLVGWNVEAHIFCVCAQQRRLVYAPLFVIPNFFSSSLVKMMRFGRSPSK